MKSLLGFHPPHFSEEEPWLPAWLQPSSTGLECPSAQSLEEMGRLQQNISPGENGNLSNDGMCKSLHLFLSGDDNSPMNFPSCSSNHEAQYHLHLSSIDESPTLSKSQTDKSESNPKAKVISDEGNLGTTCPKSPKVDARYQKADINDAIELAVAASEALTIHKVLKDELLIASSVLEAALRLKQARLENFRENLSNSIEESNEFDFDFLSDLDYLTMADAYEDVGLTVATHDDLSAYCSVSLVNDTFGSENYIPNANHEGNILSKGSMLESCEGVTRKKHVDYESLGTENADLACDVDRVFDCSVEQTDFCETEIGMQKEGFSIGDLTSSKIILRSNEEQDRMTNLAPDRFQSRWFGGWTCKNEASVPAVTNDKHKRTANETSSLSESADIAPDMSSCMQIRKDKDKTVSQSSVAPQHSYENANNNGILISDDVALSLNVSPTDPLCSVVPCSYTSDSVTSQNSKHHDNHPGPTVQPNVDNLKVNGQSSPIIHRQVACLKTYSMLYPTCNPYLDKEHTPDKSSSFEHNETAKALTGQREKDLSQRVESIVPRRKRVRFSETEICYRQVKRFQKTRLKDPSVASRICKRVTRGKPKPMEVKKTSKTLFQDLKFLLTGFSVKKHKQINILIQENGGIVFDDIPSTSRRKKPSDLPVILCPKKLLTTKFLYGCAINASILKITWLFDSVDEGLVLPHKKYRVLNDHATNKRLIFDNVAIMVHGKQDFCSKMGMVIKHGGGSVFKTFHWLVKSLDSKKVSVGVIVMEDENGMSRQLRQCALEQKVPVMPYSWIINCLYAGKLLPSPQLKLPDHLVNVELSEEI